MTKADKVTLSRIFLAPLFFVVYRYQVFAPVARIVVLWLLFWVIEISDLVDGRVARSSNQVSDFGKLFDPFADVLARVTYFVCFAFDGIMPLWILLVILYREFGISFLRMMLSARGIAMGARRGGKLKAGLYMVSGVLSLLFIMSRDLSVFQGLRSVLSIATLAGFSLAALVSVLSFLDYLREYRRLTA